MPIEASSSASRLSVVLVRAGGLLCALPLASVIETLRNPSIMPIAGTPAWVRGIAVIRGGTVAVVDLGILLGSGAGASRQPRVVTVRVGSRIVGLAADSIVGVREFERSVLSEVPPMLRQAHPEVLAAMGMLDEPLMVLDGVANYHGAGTRRVGGYTMRTDAALDEANLLRFAELIDGRLGLRFDDSSLKELAAILRARARSLRCASVDAYLHRFDAPGSMHEELRALASMLTIGETYFFRSPEQFTVFSELALPSLARTQPDRKIRILSAGMRHRRRGVHLCDHAA